MTTRLGIAAAMHGSAVTTRRPLPARCLVLALSVAIAGCGAAGRSSDRVGMRQQAGAADCAALYVIRPLDHGGYAVLQVLGTASLRPALAGASDSGGAAEYLNFYATPPSGVGVLFCDTVFGWLSPCEFSTVQSAKDAIQSQTVSCCAPGVHWLIPTRETEILGQAGRYALTADDGAFSQPWYVVRRRHAQEVDVLSCTTAAALLKAVTPVLPGNDSGLPPSVRTLSRTGSRKANVGSYVLRLDRAGSVHVLRIEATLFREVYLEADDGYGRFDTPESVDLMIVGTAFRESFGDVHQATAAIETGRLTAEEEGGVWPVPPRPTRAFLVYDRSGSTIE